MNVTFPFKVEIKATARGATLEQVEKRLKAIENKSEYETERQYLLGVHSKLLERN